MNQDRPASLNETMQSVEELIRKRSSLWSFFLQGVVRGVGGVIGATLIGGLVISIIISSVSQASDLPIVGEFFENGQIESYLLN